MFLSLNGGENESDKVIMKEHSEKLIDCLVGNMTIYLVAYLLASLLNYLVSCLAYLICFFA